MHNSIMGVRDCTCKERQSIFRCGIKICVCEKKQEQQRETKTTKLTAYTSQQQQKQIKSTRSAAKYSVCLISKASWAKPNQTETKPQCAFVSRDRHEGRARIQIEQQDVKTTRQQDDPQKNEHKQTKAKINRAIGNHQSEPQQYSNEGETKRNCKLAYTHQQRKIHRCT